jgi:hypothetical protein
MKRHEESKESAPMKSNRSDGSRIESMIRFLSLISVLSFTNWAWAWDDPGQKWTDEERAIINDVAKGKKAKFDNDKKPKVRAALLKYLSTGSIQEANRPLTAVLIQNIEVQDKVDLSADVIQPYFSIKECVFHDDVDFDYCRFKSGLNLSSCDFQGRASFQGMEVNGPFRCMWSRFHRSDQHDDRKYYVDFSGVRVTGMFRLDEAQFEDSMTMKNARVDAEVDCSKATFAKWTRIVQARIGGSLLIYDATFRRGLRLDGTTIDGSIDATKLTMINGLECDNLKIGEGVDFEGAQFTATEDDEYYRRNTFSSTVIGSNLSLERACFQKDVILFFTGLKIGGKLDIRKAKWPEGTQCIHLSGMTFHDVVPTEKKTFTDLLERSSFDADAYHGVEHFLRSHGYFDDANAIGFRRAARERGEKSFFPWVWSWFLCIAIGNGYYPGITVLWSIVIVVVGAFVFHRDRMVPVDNQSQTATPYSPFVYSFDLFIPAVDFGASKHWVPKPGQTAARCWMYAQKALGWLLVPIALLAFSGIIKV